MPKGYMLTAEAVQKIKADHESLRLRVRDLEAKAARPQSQVAIENIIYVKVTEQVTPVVNGVLGTGKAVVQEYKRQESQTKEITYKIENQTRREDYRGTEEPREIEVYNQGLVPIAVDAIVLCFRDFKSGRFIVEPAQTAIGKTPNGISARGTTLAGSGQVDIYYLDGYTLTYSGYGLTAYNIADAAVAGGQYVMIKRNANADKWFVDMAECE